MILIYLKLKNSKNSLRDILERKKSSNLFLKKYIITIFTIKFKNK